MTEKLYMIDAYRKSAPARVVSITDQGGIVLDQSLFYPTSGGQPGDQGRLDWDGGQIKIATTVKGQGDDIVLIPDQGSVFPAVGDCIEQHLDWDIRYAHMRVHTALHLLSVVIPLPVTGGQITAIKGRLDFNMPDALEDKDGLSDRLNSLIHNDYPVTDSWITDAELDSNPGLVKTMSVAPTRGSGRVRLVRIGDDTAQIDLQPCGGTHVARTGEIGEMVIGKVEKKGRQNRRVSIIFKP